MGTPYILTRGEATPNTFQPQRNSSSVNGKDEVGVQTFFSITPCLIFLYINCVMLYTLRSKTVFRETSRYLLLYSLLLAETIQMVAAQLMFLLATGKVLITRLACLLILVLTVTATNISPYNLAVMSLERYVAVCFPLRYANIVNATSTYGAIATVWAVSLANMLVRVTMLMVLDHRPFGQFVGVICAKSFIFRLKIFTEFESGYVCAEFVLVGLIIICSYVGVIMAAKSASTDKASAIKARKTVLLHMIQLCLSLSSTLMTTIQYSLIGKVDALSFSRIRATLFICLINLPRCLSCLIYGLRDQTIRPILVRRLRLGMKWPNVHVSHLQPK